MNAMAVIGDMRFTAGFLDIFRLDILPLDRGVDEEVDLSEADSQPGGEFTPGHLGRSVELPQDTERLLIVGSIRQTKQLNGHPVAPSRSFCEHCAKANLITLESQDKKLRSEIILVLLAHFVIIDLVM
jgi:hypothetical protein